MLIERYLSDEVLEDSDQHCPLYALPADVVRAGPEPQRAYTAVLHGMAGVLRRALPDGCPDADTRVQLIVTLCVGSMVLARATHDPALSKAVRATARKQALALLAA